MGGLDGRDCRFEPIESREDGQRQLLRSTTIHGRGQQVTSELDLTPIERRHTTVQHFLGFTLLL
jgi:hypothetical protein